MADPSIQVVSNQTSDLVNALAVVRDAVIDTTYPNHYTINVTSSDDIGTSNLGFPSTRFTVSLKQPLAAPENYEFAVETHNLSVPYSFFQVGPDQNNDYIKMSIGFSSVTVQLDPQTFDSYDTFCTFLDLYVNGFWSIAVGGNFGDWTPFSFQYYYGRIFIYYDVIDGSIDAYWNLPLYGPTSPVPISFHFSEGLFFRLVGFPAATVNMAGIRSIAYWEYSTYQPDILPVDKLFLRSDLSVANAFSTSVDGSANEIHQLYLKPGDVFGDQITGGIDNIITRRLHNRSISTIQFWLTDEDNNEIDLRGLPYSFTLRIVILPIPSYRIGTKRAREEVNQQVAATNETRIAQDTQTAQRRRLQEINLRNIVTLNSIATRLQQGVLGSNTATQQNNGESA